MKVIISDASKRMVYHRSGCIYASRITSSHQMTLNIRDAVAYGYHECTCCGGLKGAVRVNRNSLNKAGKDIAFEYLYDERSDTLYIRTEIGFWKMLFREWFVKKASATVFFLGYIWVLIDDKNRGWHDKVLDTYVVDLKESEKLNAANRRRHQQTRRPADRPAPERRTPEMKSALMSPAEEVKEVMNEAPEAEVHVQGGSGLSPETAGSVLDVSETIVKKADDAAAEVISDNQAPEDSEVQAEPEAAEPEAVPEAEETPAEEANEAPEADATVSEAPEADATVSEAPEEAN